MRSCFLGEFLCRFNVRFVIFNQCIVDVGFSENGPKLSGISSPKFEDKKSKSGFFSYRGSDPPREALQALPWGSRRRCGRLKVICILVAVSKL